MDRLWRFANSRARVVVQFSMSGSTTIKFGEPLHLRKLPYLGGPWEGVFIQVAYKGNYLSLWHHLSPFQRLKMIPGSVSEHLLSQENRPSCSDVSHLISNKSPLYLPQPPIAKLGNRVGKMSKHPKKHQKSMFLGVFLRSPRVLQLP